MATNIGFVPNIKCDYKYDYQRIWRDIALGNVQPEPACRDLILNDLFFILVYVMQLEWANKPFIVKACREVEEGPASNTLDLWAREHLKSTIITTAETVQYHLKYPEKCTGIFSYVRPLAKKLLFGVKQVYENSEMLKVCFPDIVYQKPELQSIKWSEDEGIILNRKSISRREATVEAWGLVEGMPVGRHFDRRIYDDIETDDLVENPDMMRKVVHKFEMSKYLGTDGGVQRVVGTYYHHAGPIASIRDMKYPAEPGQRRENMFTLRFKPGTENGKEDGAPVLVSDARHRELKGDKKSYNTQFLLNPTPEGAIKLHSNYLKKVEPGAVPFDVIKFILVDNAGDDESNAAAGDSWAYGCIGVQPKRDNLGQSNIYILDGESGPMGNSEAVDGIVRMYLRNGIIHQLGVEKVGMSTTEVHVSSALEAHGRRLSLENGNLVLLKPRNRKKNARIEAALSWPLNNGKIHYASDLRADFIEGLMAEMDKFPFYHVNILDMISYLYDMIKDFPFGRYESTQEIDLSEVFI